MVFYGLSPKLGPIAEWGLDITKKSITNALRLISVLGGGDTLAAINKNNIKQKLGSFGVIVARDPVEIEAMGQNHQTVPEHE